jgi:hypothetical protein
MKSPDSQTGPTGYLRNGSNRTLGTRHVDRNKSAVRELSAGLLNNGQDQRTDPFWTEQITAQLQDTRSLPTCGSQSSAKVEIACHQDITVFNGPTHDFRVRSITGANARPMNRLKACPGQIPDPVGRDIHIDQKLHSETGSSISRS